LIDVFRHHRKKEMTMIVLVILALLASIAISIFIVFANGMSDSPSTPFVGGWIIAAAWFVTAALWLAWLVG
jgi:cation transport ATPase